MIFSPPPALLFRSAGVRKILSFTYRLHRRPRRDDQLGSSSIGVARAIIGAACREPENGRGSKLCRRSPCRFGLDAGDAVRMELHLFGLEGVESPRHRLTLLIFARAPTARRSSVHFFSRFRAGGAGFAYLPPAQKLAIDASSVRPRTIRCKPSATVTPRYLTYSRTLGLRPWTVVSSSSTGYGIRARSTTPDNAAMARAICRREVISASGPLGTRRSSQHFVSTAFCKVLSARSPHSTQQSTSRCKSGMFGFRAENCSTKRAGRMPALGFKPEM